MKSRWIVWFIIGFFGILHAADPVVSQVVVNQHDIAIDGQSCEGRVFFTTTDPDDDSLLIALELSSDDGENWNIPLFSKYFFRAPVGPFSMYFKVKKHYGARCRAKITAYDSLPVSGGMRCIPAAGHTFFMGSDSARREESPSHIVKLLWNFWMDTTEISQSMFKIFNAEYVPHFFGLYYYDEDPPVDNCFWHSAIGYCNWRSAREGLDPCYSGFPEGSNSFSHFFNVQCDRAKNGYRLPTEAEWEYACRSGTPTNYFWGNDTVQCRDYSWYKGNFSDTIHSRGKRKPNTFGLYDMIGGMLELCNDWYDSDYYSKSPLADPSGPSAPAAGETDPFRVTRGGYFLSLPRDMTSSSRIGNFSSARHPHTFRCVRTIP